EVERARHAEKQLKQRLRRYEPLALEHDVESFALKQLEDEERRSILGLPEIENLDDARAPNAPARLRFVEEATQSNRVFGHVGPHYLQGDVAIDQLVSRLPHGPARPGTEHPHQAVTRLNEVAGVQTAQRIPDSRLALRAKRSSLRGFRLQASGGNHRC